MASLLLLLTLFLCFTFTSIPFFSPVSAQPELKTYIFRVDSFSKPAVFPSHYHWYSSEFTEPVNILHVYDNVFHGFSASLSPSQAASVLQHPSVLASFEDRRRQLHTTRSPQFLGLRNQKGLWSESDYGSDVIVGVLDTGIWPERRSFSDLNLGPVPTRWKGVCETGAKFTARNCNRKIIGARFFSKGHEAAPGFGPVGGGINDTVEFRSPRDADGHGTHTASTAAGRHAFRASMSGYASGVAKGVAPKARLAVYKVCWKNSGCFDSDILAAFDAAVSDGVDVISISIGGGDGISSPYYLDPIAIGAYGAVSRGVFVSSSAGNDGPNGMSVTNLAPWLTTVGAGTIDRNFPSEVILGDGRKLSGVSLYAGKPLNGKMFPSEVASEETPKVGNDADGDGVSRLVEVNGSLEDVGGREREISSQGAEAEQGPGHLVGRMNGEENIADKTDEEMVDGETAEEDTTSVKRVYAVGDFVWGKIKSHPWWPGRVYDASAASDFAMKYNQTGRLLVAYFGDGSFSWCPPSQLVPFVDNFGKMSKQSTSKSFLYAVEKALDEISVLVEFQMTCQCISEESRTELSWPLAVNAGIKKGVQVPVGETVSLLLSHFEPAERLKDLKLDARINSISNALEFAVLKSWLSAFYRAKYGSRLASYSEPLQVEGLEDKEEDQVIDAHDFSIPIEVPIQGPSEEETPNSGSSKFPMISCDKIYQKRKQKSVAELMGENAKPKGKKTTEEDSTPSSLEISEKKRKKSGEKAKGHSGSSKSVDEKNGKQVSKQSGDSDLAKKKKLRVSIPERDELGDKRDMNASPLSRERKKSKYLSPPYLSPVWNVGKSSFKRELEIESQKISDISKIGERMTKAARLLLSSPDANGNEVDNSSQVRNRSSVTVDTVDLNSSVDEILAEVQSTAIHPLSLRNGSLEKARGFISTFRSSVYFDGSNYKQYHQVEGVKKRKSVGSGHVISHSDTKSPDSVPSHAKKRKTNYAKSVVTKLNKESGPPSQGKEDEEDGGETSSVILTVTFSTGFSLPSEEEIIRIYNQFGELNEEETKVLSDSNSARIVYRRGSDAAQAFKESVRQSPFGPTNVNFMLSYSSSNSESPLSLLKARKGKSPVQLMKQKLKGMTSILEKCKGKISSKGKSELESEIKGLLEKVSAVTSTNP